MKIEYILALMLLLFAAGYAFVVARNIEKGKEWAFDIVRAMAALEPRMLDSTLFVPKREDRADSGRSVSAASSTNRQDPDPIPSAGDDPGGQLAA